MRFPFPKDFQFGAASSACQIESGIHEGGKGNDVHTRNFMLHPEQYRGADFDCSADFYHRYPQDIEMMQELGIRVFRFSVSWSRIFPDGPDRVNQAGLAYYADIARRLHEAGIAAFFDLWHCDLPQWAAERGGLLHPDFIDWFVLYAKTVFAALGDRVDYWSTVNEPNINCMLAYLNGKLPPFVADLQKAIQACHNMILAHCRVIRLYREMGFPGQVGSVVHFEPCYGQNPLDERDSEAAERKQAHYSGWWLEPMLKGHYPEPVLKYPYIRDKMPAGAQEQLAAEFIPCDFVSVNYYSPGFARFADDGMLEYETVYPSDLPKDDYGFYAYPQGLYDTLMYLKEQYPGKDIWITENGIGKWKWGNHDEERSDPYRVNYLREHLRSLSRALQAGAPVKGYFHWSLMDTNELRSGGYDIMFGLLQVDYQTKERRPRDSWYFYQKVIADGYVD